MDGENDELRDRRRYVLETDEIVAVVVPDEGGRISSLRSKASGLEFLTQASPSKRLINPAMNLPFHEGACAGAEECLPSVAPCGADTEGGAVPDHGDFWQLPWQVTEAPTSTQLCMEATGFSRPLRFRKELHLHASRLEMAYRVENIGQSDVSFLYAHHPLFAVAAGDRVMLATDRLLLNYSLDGRLGAPGALIDWPICHTQRDFDLSLIDDASARTAEMLYSERQEDGRCGLWRASHQQAVWLTWDTNELPFLGLWLCYGGWPNLAGIAQQYAVALEPTLAPCGSLVEAQRKDLAKVLAPGGCFEWSIQYQLSKPGMPLEQCGFVPR
jgi:galactose mutarotase-like enzyme